MMKKYPCSQVSITINQLIDQPEKIKTVVAIFFYGRSGSFLLQSLLDEHPGILTVPPHALCFFPFLSPDEMRFPPPQRAEAVATRAPFLFVETTSHSVMKGGENVEAPGVIKAAFLSSLTTIFERWDRAGRVLDSSLLLKAIHFAYAVALGRNTLAGTPVIVWSAHKPEKQLVETLLRECDDFRSVTTVRYPIKSLDSHFQHHLVEKPFMPAAQLPRFLMGLIFDHDRTIAQLPPEKRVAVRFEDMHNQPDMVTNQLLDWLDLCQPDQGSTSTLDGAPLLFRKNNGYVTGTRKGAGDDRCTAWLNCWEGKLFHYILQRNYQEWQYEKLSPSLPPLVVEAMEEGITTMEFGSFWLDIQKGEPLFQRCKLLWREKKLITAMLREERRQRADGISLPSLLGAPSGTVDDERNCGALPSSENIRRAELVTSRSLEGIASLKVALFSTAPIETVREVVESLGRVIPDIRITLITQQGRGDMFADSFPQCKVVEALPPGLLRFGSIKRIDWETIDDGDYSLMGLIYNHASQRGYLPYHLALWRYRSSLKLWGLFLQEGRLFKVGVHPFYPLLAKCRRLVVACMSLGFTIYSLAVFVFRMFTKRLSLK